MTTLAVPTTRKRVEPSQGATLCLGMLRTALLGAHLVAGLVIIGAAIISGGTAAANAAVAAALVVVFFASGQAVQLLAGELANGTAMVLVMTSYLARVALLGLLLAFAMARQAELERYFIRGAFLAGAIAALLGWLGGIFLRNATQRVFLYDRDFDTFRKLGD
ncbi:MULTISPECIES: hypothetical protein [unclassified Luteococcus]|uniref:hypothetical protein n=1 Tax=unclassified Luteococcus TaxID=2639923 RepID=UPI00313B55E3